jgi:hypothetical protein
MNTTHASSFGIYETARIFAPGLYFASLAALYYRSFLIAYLPLSSSTIAILFFLAILAPVSGLTMYAKETTKLRRAFVENQPSAFLQTMARKRSSVQPLDDTEARQLYFYILNHFVPPAFHEKVFFFGTVYHIMIQIRRTSFWFSLVALVSLLIEVSGGAMLADLRSQIAFSSFVLLIYLLNVKYNKADRKMQENYKDQIFWLQMNEDLVGDLLQKFDLARQTRANEKS